MKNMQVSDMSPMIGRTITFNTNLFLKLIPNGIPPRHTLLHLLLKHSKASPQSAGDVTKNHLVPRCCLSIQCIIIPHPSSSNPKYYLTRLDESQSLNPEAKRRLEDYQLTRR